MTSKRPKKQQKDIDGLSVSSDYPIVELRVDKDGFTVRGYLDESFSHNKKLVADGNHDLYRIFDADGNEIKYVESCDIRTGEVTQFKIYNENNTIVDSDNLIRETKFYKAPLQTVKIG